MDLYTWTAAQIEYRALAVRAAVWDEDGSHRWTVHDRGAQTPSGAVRWVVVDQADEGVVASRPTAADDEAVMRHIALNDPASVLRRCAADRRLLERHRPGPDGSGFPDMLQCPTCSQDGRDGYQYLVCAPCPTLQDLADGYGWADTGAGQLS